MQGSPEEHKIVSMVVVTTIVGMLDRLSGAGKLAERNENV
jgi:hypothetical protein